MSNPLFGRTWKIQVESDVFDGFDVSFQVERTTASSANQGKVSIWNAPRAIRDRLSAKKNPVVRLEAGYQGNNNLIFLGRARSVIHTWSGADVVTELACADGQQEIRESRISQSFPPGVAVAEVGSAICRAFRGITTDSAQATLRAAVGPATAPGGAALFGPVQREMDSFCRAYGLGWSVQSGVLMVSPRGRAASEVLVHLTPETGLIEPAPSVDARGQMRATSLLHPNLSPGVLVQIKCRALEGRFRVERVNMIGETFGNSWFSEIEGKQI